MWKMYHKQRFICTINFWEIMDDLYRKGLGIYCSMDGKTEYHWDYSKEGML